MNYPTTRIVFDRKHVSSNTKEGLVQLEVLFKGVRRYFSTGVKVTKNRWSRSGKVTGCMDMIVMNRRIDEMKRMVDKYIVGLMENGEPFDFDRFKAWMVASDEQGIGFYNVDFKSWASQLTDAVVGAWEKGEDAVEAYHDKAKSLVGDLTKNIITQNIMERALQPALDYLTQELKNKNGLLDESSIVGLGKLLDEAGDKSIANITSVLEMLKKNGWDLSADSSGSTTNSVKSITEDTGGLLASYLNSIRLDVSVNRDNIQLIADSMQSLTDMNIISKSQLSSLNQLVDLAVYRNGVLDDMYGWMRKVSMGTERVCVK